VNYQLKGEKKRKYQNDNSDFLTAYHDIKINDLPSFSILKIRYFVSTTVFNVGFWIFFIQFNSGEIWRILRSAANFDESKQQFELNEMSVNSERKFESCIIWADSKFPLGFILREFDGNDADCHELSYDRERISGELSKRTVNFRWHISNFQKYSMNLEKSLELS